MRALLLLAVLAFPVAAQPPVWAPLVGSIVAEPVIASSSKSKPVPMISVDMRLPPPDDGLQSLMTHSPVAPPPKKLPVDLGLRPVPTTIQPVNAVVTPVAGLAVDIRASDRILQGQPVQCSISARSGSTSVSAARIELPIPAGSQIIRCEPQAQRTATGLVWELGDLAAGMERVLRAEFIPVGADELNLRPMVSYAATASARTKVEQPPMGLMVSAPDTATVGDQVTLKIQIRNNTPSTLRNVFINCVLPDGLVHTQGQRIVAELPGDLSPAQERTAELVLRAGHPGNKTISIEARADGGVIAQTRTVIDTKSPVVSIQVQTTRRVRIGEEFSIRLLVANPGRTSTPSLSAFLPLPEGVEFVSVGEGGMMHPSGNCLYWPLGELPSEGHRVVTATLRGRSGGDWAITGVANGEGIREVRNTSAVLVEQTPQLAMELTRLEDDLKPGAETIYSVRVYNPGPGDTRNIQSYIDFPEHLLPVQGEGPTRWQITGQRIIFEPLANVPTRMDATFAVRVRATREGTGNVKASVLATGLPSSMTRELPSRAK